jgi:hypothetical protein
MFHSHIKDTHPLPNMGTLFSMEKTIASKPILNTIFGNTAVLKYHKF